MNVYVIILTQRRDLYWYILDEANWNKLDSREICEQIHDVDHVGAGFAVEKMFDLIQANKWVVADALSGMI